MPITDNPPYSFVRVEDDVINCPETNLPCLPIVELSDLRFQMTIDSISGSVFGEVPPYSRTFDVVLATPCGTTAQEIFDGSFANFKKVTGFDAVIGQPLTIAFSGTISGIEVGQTVFFEGGDAGEYPGGYYTILNIDTTSLPGDTLLTISADSVAIGAGTGQNQYYVIVFTMPMIIAESLENYGGGEHLMDFNNYINELTQVNGECFNFCIWKLRVGFSLDTDDSGALISSGILGSTNCFVKTDDLCFTTKIKYGNDEDSFGFIADGSGYQNSVRLPMFLSRPKYPGKEAGYQFGTGRFKKLSERRNKSWQLKTDWIIEAWHERLVIALACDNIQVTNEVAGLTAENIYKSEEYKINWDEAEFDRARVFAPGSVEVFKELFANSVNSNCV